MAQSVTSFEANARSAPEPSPRMPSRFDGVIPDSKKLSAQGARPAVAMFVFPHSRRGGRPPCLCSVIATLTSRGDSVWPPGQAATMNGKIESHSNNYTESNVNRPPGCWAVQAHTNIDEM